MPDPKVCGPAQADLAATAREVSPQEKYLAVASRDAAVAYAHIRSRIYDRVCFESCF